MNTEPEYGGQHGIAAAEESLWGPDDRCEILGKMSWLWMCSPLHRHWSTQLQRSFLIPPLHHKQYLLMERNGRPVASCTWAFLSVESELAYLKDSSVILPDQWHSGDRMWIVDWIAPFGMRDSLAMKRRLQTCFRDEVARAIRIKPGASTARLLRLSGPDAIKDEADRKLDAYQLEMLEHLQLRQMKMPIMP